MLLAVPIVSERVLGEKSGVWDEEVNKVLNF